MKRNVDYQEWEQINAGQNVIEYNNEILGRKADFEQADRLRKFFEKTPQILDDIDKEFEDNVKLDAWEIKLLFVAVAMQCIRQYILTPFIERVDDKTAAKRVKSGREEHSSRKHRLYYPSLQEIITNPVPFDTNFGSRNYDLGIGGGFTHRAKTIGHDPLLGLIFGTMNICTSTMTTWEFKSFHIKTGHNILGRANDQISLRADTKKVIGCTWDRFLSGMEGRTAVVTSFMKEIQHLKSDIGSKASLPLPVVSAISPDMAKRLADYGLDMANVLDVSKQLAFAAFINSIIAIFHGMFYDPAIYSSWSLYEVKTRKIIDISNIIAGASNVIFVALSSYISKKNTTKYLDIGGISVTLWRLITDTSFVHSVKEEYVKEIYIEKMRGI